MNGDHGIAVGCVGRVGLAVGWLLLVLGCGQGPDLINEELPTRPVTIGDMVMKRHTAEDPRTNAIQSEVRRKVVEETFRVPLIFANPVAQVAFEITTVKNSNKLFIIPPHVDFRDRWLEEVTPTV